MYRLMSDRKIWNCLGPCLCTNMQHNLSNSFIKSHIWELPNVLLTVPRWKNNNLIYWKMLMIVNRKNLFLIVTWIKIESVISHLKILQPFRSWCVHTIFYMSGLDVCAWHSVPTFSYQTFPIHQIILFQRGTVRNTHDNRITTPSC